MQQQQGEGIYSIKSETGHDNYGLTLNESPTINVLENFNNSFHRKTISNNNSIINIGNTSAITTSLGDLNEFNDIPLTTNSTVNLTETQCQQPDLKVTENNNNTSMVATGGRLGTIKMGKRVALSIDVFIILCALVWLLFDELGLIPHVKRGFFCDDRSIGFKYTGDTVSVTVLLVIAFLPIFFFWLGEALIYKPTSLKKTRCKGSLFLALRWYKDYIIGLTTKLVILDTVKLIVGEHRPHFLDTCRPDAAINCTNGIYITDFECTNKEFSSYFIRDSSKSFPSGHASISIYEALFLIWYLQCRFPKIRSQFTVLGLQILCALYGCFCAASRVTDFRHHWWDVLVGTIIGLLFAGLTCTIFCKNFKVRKDDNNYKLNHNGNSIPIMANGTNGTNTTHDHHTSVKRLLSDGSCKDELTLNHV